MARRRSDNPVLKTVNLKKNLQGMAQNIAESFMDPTMALDIVNMHCLEEGSWTSDKAGYTKINAGGVAYESGAVVDGLHWFTDDTFTDNLLMASNTKLFEVDPETGVATEVDGAAGFTAGNPVDMQTYNYSVFMADGAKAAPRKWNGVAGADSGGWPLSDGVNTYGAPTMVETFKGRLVYGDFQTGTGAHTSYRSHIGMMNVDNGETCTLPAAAPNHGYVNGVGTGDGQRLRGMKSISITLNDQELEFLAIFKDRSIWLPKGESALLWDADSFSLARINNTYGAFNNRCVVQLGNDLVALSEKGLVTVIAASQGGNLRTDPLESDKVKKVLRRINRNAKDQCWAEHLEDRREVWFWVPTGASTQCNEAIIYRYANSADKFKVARYSRREDAGGKFKMSCGTKFQDAWFVGSYDGIIGEMFTSSKYDDTGIPFKYEHAAYDFGNEKQIKEILNADAHFKIRSDHEITIRAEWEGGNHDITEYSYPINTTVEGDEWGAFNWGDGYYGELEEVFTQYKVFGCGRKVKHTISGVTTETGVEYLGLTPILSPGKISQDWH